MLESLLQLGVYGMTGVIWIVQLLVYPAFLYSDAAQWHRYHSAHTGRITLIVFPLMLMHLIAAGMLYWETRDQDSLIHFIIAVLTWGSTLTLFVPLHNRIARRPDVPVIKRLIQLNWIRTFLWTLATLLLVTKQLQSFPS